MLFCVVLFSVAALHVVNGHQHCRAPKCIAEHQNALQTTHRHDSTPTHTQGLVKQFFNEKEVTSTLVMDALLCGCKQLEAASRGVAPSEADAAAPMVVVDAERNTFAVQGCLVDALQRAAVDVLPPSG